MSRLWLGGYLCWAVWGIDLNGPLNHSPAEIDVEVAEVSWWTATVWGDLKARSQVSEDLWKEVCMIPDFGFAYTICWGFYSAGRCTVRTQCFGNTRDTWGYGNLLTSFGSVTHYTCRLNLGSALQVCYYTEVMIENVNCCLRQAVWYLVIYPSL